MISFNILADTRKYTTLAFQFNIVKNNYIPCNTVTSNSVRIVTLKTFSWRKTKSKLQRRNRWSMKRSFSRRFIIYFILRGYCQYRMLIKNFNSLLSISVQWLQYFYIHCKSVWFMLTEYIKIIPINLEVHEYKLNERIGQ